MGIRLTTATAILLATTALVACGEDEDEVDAGDAVVVDEVETVEAEPEAVVVEEVAEAEAEMEIVEEEIVDAAEAAEEGLETAVEDTAEVLDVEPDGDELPASIAGTEAELETDIGAADAVTLAEEPEIVVDEVDSAAAEALEEETEAEVLAEGQIVQDEPVLETAEGDEAVDDDGLMTLSTNTTVVDADDLSSTEDGTDAEAVVIAGAETDVQVEETNDVATDGIDSLSELAMLDMENLAIGTDQIDRLTTLIEDSDSLSATQKITLVAGLDAARDDPERLSEILEQIVTLTAAE
ncbi:MAG: hypothetical protein ACU0BS_07175 [Hasllibacter sp.]